MLEISFGLFGCNGLGENELFGGVAPLALFTEGWGVGIKTPLFQINFLPDLTQVNFFPPLFWVAPSFAQLPPALGGVANPGAGRLKQSKKTKSERSALRMGGLICARAQCRIRRFLHEITPLHSSHLSCTNSLLTLFARSVFSYTFLEVRILSGAQF